MSKFKPGEKVYYSAVGVLAEVAEVLAVKERLFVKPLYLVREEDSILREWADENKLTKIEVEVL